ncbi:tryptophan synthase subunit alpha [Nostocoides sp. F2B08]|uniref:tryptophan synthase subunit alpha n=1 Tax=Nostocoides sp. F2B08 TaxID=2653936 RepID=UPI0012631F8B|nr:tryptophan synthase subunit alpha [Tetrasphaera sp. F2B08]KAB7744576.1 tryptophan synthase subunit alpha [Tetrasphaera sp. F2B08]
MSVREVLDRCAAQGRPALIAYLPVGYPTVEGSIAAMRAVVESGADIVEVGVPYSDPVMDGAVIQEAAETALARGVRVDDAFAAVSAVRESGGTPVVMSYYNIVLHRGVARFAADLSAAGGAGLITPDLIPDEAGDWIEASDAYHLDRIFLVAPSSTPERLAAVTSACRGFVYAASTMGVTGVRSEVGDAAADLVERVRAVTDLPVCVGLGVSTGDQAAAVGAFADGVIVGSALVRALKADLDPAGGNTGELDPDLRTLRSTTAELADGVRRARTTTGSR